MDDQYHVVLADFGLAMQLPCHENQRHMPLPFVGSLLWRAPELLTHSLYYTDQIDVWSLGITMLEYLINNTITEPHHQFLENDDEVAILYQIFTQSTPFIIPDQNHVTMVKQNQLHAHLDVVNILHDYQIHVDQQMIKLLIVMLQLNPQDRLKITSFDYDICPTTVSILSRGELYPNNNLTFFYTALLQMIKVSDLLALNIKTCLMSIDLFERYVVHFHLPALKQYDIVSATCLLLMAKVNEGYNIDLDELINYYGTFNVTSLKLMQIIILKNLNYVLTSCELDEILDYFNTLIQKEFVKKTGVNDTVKISLIEHQVIYPLFLKLYTTLNELNLFSGELFSFELIEYL
jgi:hypothetical protein